ncbi:MAG TPA: glycosyltransferase family 87 protein [Phycisphaerae bacterium]|nr:glycosyltransferase family 87 protein [Phycisphaerae bacterium]
MIETSGWQRPPFNEPQVDAPTITRWLGKPWLVAIAWAAVILTLGSGVLGGLHRGMNDEPDWRAFSRETGYVWEHRAIPPWTGMFGYLPGAFLALMPFTVWAPRWLGVSLFVTANTLAAVGTAWLLYRWWWVQPAREAGRPTDGRLFVWPLFLMVAHFQHVLQGNQLTIGVLFLCVTGLTLVLQRRELTGGVLVGLAGCLKVTPFFLLVFFALQRRWRAVWGLMLAILLFDVLPSCMFFGIDGAVREHSNWIRRVEWYSNHRFIEDPWLRIGRHGHEHNCSLAVVLTRWLRAAPTGDHQVVVFGDAPAAEIEAARAKLRSGEHLTVDPMPRDASPWSIGRYTHSDRSKIPRFHAANWSAPIVWGIWIVLEALVIGGILIATAVSRRGPPNSASFTAQAALWLILMLWPSPMVRDYYLALALPACVVTWRAVLARSSQGPMTIGTRLAATAVFGSYVSVLCLSWDAANWYGVHLLTLVGLGMASVWAGCNPESVCRNTSTAS